MRRPRTVKNNEGVLRPGALNEIRHLKLLEFLLLGNVLSDRALKAVPGIGHIPILYTNQPNNLWRARYREFDHNEAERLTKDIGSYVLPRYIELGPHADAVSVYHEAVHARRALLGRSMLPKHAEPSLYAQNDSPIRSNLMPVTKNDHATIK